jgi:hypothetical protein
MTNNKQQTAVDSIIEFCKNKMFMEASVHQVIYLSLIKFCQEQAKEMEKEQAQAYAAFCVGCDRKKLPLLEFDGWVKLGDEQ